MAQIQLGAAVVLTPDLLCQRIDFLRQNGYAAAHFVIPHFGDSHFFADLFAIGVVINAVIGQTATHLVHAHFVLRGNVSDSFIKLLVGDFYAHFLAHLQDDLVHDQTLQNLVAQRTVIR